MPDARYERVAATPAAAHLSHIRPWRLRVKGSGQRILDERQRPLQGRTRCFGPLDAEGGRSKLRASGEGSLRAAEACKALPRAGCEAPDLLRY
jgi:hypothetical protein